MLSSRSLPTFIVSTLFACSLCSTNNSQAAPPTTHFATAEEGRKALRVVDDFVSRLSDFDRSARLKTSKAVAQDQFLDHVAAQVLDWDEASRSKVEAAFALIKDPLAGLALNWPASVNFIVTTGNEEGGAPYTRGNSIILPKLEMEKSPEALAGTIAHEFFHVLSRANSALRQRLYQVIGFSKCDEVQLPADLAKRRITNPDAPAFDHAIEVTVGGTKQRVVPVLLSKLEQYPEGSQEEFFKFLTLQFWPLDQAGGDGKPTLYSFNELSGFIEQVGKNTNYIIHPEEILADNFKLLIKGDSNVPSPEIIERLREALKP